MKSDPAIEAVRTVRKQISSEHGNDVLRLVAHYRDLERQFANRLIRNRLPKAS